MNGIEALWATSAVQAIAWALVHFLWQGALVGLATAGTLTLLGKGKASVRYAVALGTLFLLLACPVVTALRIAGPVTESGESSIPGNVGAGLAPTRAADHPAPAFRSEPVRDLLPLALPWVFGLWLAGVAALSVYHLGGWRLARSLKRRGTRPVSGGLETKLRDLARRMSISRAVELLESSAVPVPAVIGWLKPVILVPASAMAGLSPRQLEAILAHELAHVRRHDYLVNLLQTVVETLLFYHPAVWWVSGQVRRERENCCDDLAVAVCGDRLGYARALADLEGLRVSSPRLAMAADGGSLVDRIRRLVAAPAPGSRRSWLAGVLAFSLLPFGVTFNYARLSPSTDDAASAVSTPGGRQDTGRRGTWSAEREEGGKIHLEMRMHGTWGSWEESNSYPASTFKGLGAGPEVRFDLPRDAGTFHFEGRFEGRQGTGFFTFEGNPAYARQMQALGYEAPDRRLLELALHDVSLDFVRQMKELGHGNASLDRLVEFRIHGVTPEFVRAMASSGYRELPADRLVEFRIHGVTPEFVRGMVEAGYRDLPPDRLVEFRIHGVSPKFVQEFSDEGYRDLGPERLVEFRIHGVTPEFVEELARAGYRNLPPERLVEFRIHGINGDFIRKAASQGYKNLSAEELVELKIRGRLDR
jgi:beta-lactamase regulating signal transducer with metallopeptidase domain